jgi:hypothetical protein
MHKDDSVKFIYNLLTIDKKNLYQGAETFLRLSRFRDYLF